MVFPSISPSLLSCLFLLVTLLTPSPTCAWYAVFYNSTLKNQLKQEFLDVTPLNHNDTSFTVAAYDHTTIAFAPNETMIAYYNTLLGKIQTAHILAYAHDEHGQAILLNYDGADAIQTVNEFPHTTISTSDTNGPYSAVYSNDLWARIAASGFVNITIDTTGHPTSISFAPSVTPVNNTIFANLSEFISSSNQYAATQVFIHIFEPAIGGLIQGTFCENTRWNETTGLCNSTINIEPTTPSSNSSSNSSSGVDSGSTSNSTTPSNSTSTSNSTTAPSPDTSSTASDASNSSSSSSSSPSSISSNSTSNTNGSSTAIDSSSGSNTTIVSNSSGSSNTSASGSGGSGSGSGTNGTSITDSSSGGGSSASNGNNTVISSSGSKNNTVISTGTNTNTTTPTTTAPTIPTGTWSSSTGILAAAATPSDTLSTAAQVGIGIGVGVGAVILVITVGVLLLYCVNRRDHVRTTSKMNVEMHTV